MVTPAPHNEHAELDRRIDLVNFVFGAALGGYIGVVMTRRDLTGNNGDLRAVCGRLLAAQPLTGLELTLRDTTVRAAAMGLDRLDVYVDGRPVGWHDLPRAGKPTRSVTFERPQGEQVEVLGYAGERLSQRRRLPLS